MPGSILPAWVKNKLVDATKSIAEERNWDADNEVDHGSAVDNERSEF
jgi:hypothetical protein